MNDMKPIGEVRRSLFVGHDSIWNGWVRDMTASLEVAGKVSVSAAHEEIRKMCATLMELQEMQKRLAIH